uniref:MULE transposase domain-containing protein n=1 Tax=Ditylenchus dipsaci TaxID=166011 RepID=A0A915EBY7_9BILA
MGLKLINTAVTDNHRPLHTSCCCCFVGGTEKMNGCTPNSTFNEIVADSFEEVKKLGRSATHCKLYDMYNPSLGDIRKAKSYSALQPMAFVATKPNKESGSGQRQYQPSIGRSWGVLNIYQRHSSYHFNQQAGDNTLFQPKKLDLKTFHYIGMAALKDWIFRNFSAQQDDTYDIESSVDHSKAFIRCSTNLFSESGLNLRSQLEWVPLMVAGFSDANKKFYMTHVALVSNENVACYQHFFRVIAGLTYQPRS